MAVKSNSLALCVSSNPAYYTYACVWLYSAIVWREAMLPCVSLWNIEEGNDRLWKRCVTIVTVSVVLKAVIPSMKHYCGNSI